MLSHFQESQPNDVVNGSPKWVFAGLVVFVVACAGRTQDAVSKTEDAELRSEVEDLKRAINASYDRERALAERLRSTEEDNAELRRELQQQFGQLGVLKGRLDTLSASPSPACRSRPQRTAKDIQRRTEAIRGSARALRRSAIRQGGKGICGDPQQCAQQRPGRQRTVLDRRMLLWHGQVSPGVDGIHEDLRLPQR